jgi:hypothetical protein
VETTLPAVEIYNFAAIEERVLFEAELYLLVIPFWHGGFRTKFY